MRLSGKDIAEKIYRGLQSRVGELQKKNITPHLVVLLIGENPASIAYVKQKKQQGEAIGCKVTVINYAETVTTEELEKKVQELNDDATVHGILIQRPLPEQIDIANLELLTKPEKDVDGFHPESPYTFPIPLAVMHILEEVYKNIVHSEQNVLNTNNFIDWITTQKIVVLGKGPTGGQPVINYLQKLNLHPQMIDSKTQNREELLQQADIIISAVGKEEVLKPEELKPDVILIGVGILRGADGKLHGDYNEGAIEQIASFYTPTPGGVGPVNVAMLFDNVLTAAERQND